jgi:hypothetical protein
MPANCHAQLFELFKKMTGLAFKPRLAEANHRPIKKAPT